MQSKREPPSMLEVSQFFLQRREYMWNGNQGSEFEENPLYKRTMERNRYRHGEEESFEENTRYTAGKLPFRPSKNCQSVNAGEKTVSATNVASSERRNGGRCTSRGFENITEDQSPTIPVKETRTWRIQKPSRTPVRETKSLPIQQSTRKCDGETRSLYRFKNPRDNSREKPDRHQFKKQRDNLHEKRVR